MSSTASSPARLICSSTSFCDRSYVSSIRAGWMRPSCTSFSSVSRAISRRTGSKLESTTASGVSSMIRFTPVVASNARMLRPSRPMMRPFMSSLGSGNTETVDSLVCSEATRWIAIVTILRARSSPSSRARCSISRTVAIASRLASSTTCVRSASLASDAVSRAIFSSAARCWVAECSSCSRTSASLRSRSSSSSARRSASSTLRSTDRSFWVRRSSWRLISSRRVRTSSSVSRRSAPISSFASTRASRVRRSASRSASRITFWALPSALSACDLATALRMTKPIATPSARATTPTSTGTIGSPPLSEDTEQPTEAHRALFGRATEGCGLERCRGRRPRSPSDPVCSL